MKIGLFFGSFNPIHHGHLMIAQAVLNQTDVQQIWFVVSPQNPHKKSKSLLHEFDRLDLVERAIADNFQFKSCDIEFSLKKPSYTIDTLIHLSEKFPQHEFELILGGDNLEQFKSWKNYDKILDYFGLYVYPRGEEPTSELWKHPKVKKVNAPVLHISATYIRECIQKNQSIKYLVPDNIEQLIAQKKFYI
ncbi:nicotinate (nicotinamide) nucleotide adenylyltransferase [Aquirufa nivalisilvae]|uniref:nicotinate (nicotinamide) nucleotide adenylyltransferase n=1 Tax=Aquirufa nivalisilvae TaxID=2516557 RepID=UPI001032D2B0|nr:nicotinate (nicotinamide) nucleotide adenylyltransferase [Aquirufa nivalisilvae]TBH76033.1 nicotinate-nucleotide adenylyltransferase [Aquirufa nivalisilvae]